MRGELPPCQKGGMTYRVTRRSKHTTHTHRDRETGFVHYREGCLCHTCPNYLGCRLATSPLAILSTHDKPYDISGDMTYQVTRWEPKKNMTPGLARVLAEIRAAPEGLTTRQIAIKTGLSARHVYRVVKVLRSRALIAKLWELRHEKILDTRLRFYETAEVAHRWVLVTRCVTGK